MKIRLYSLWVPLSVLCALTPASVAFAQGVVAASLTKAMNFEQTDASTLTATGASFSASLTGFSLPALVLTVPSGRRAGLITFDSGNSNFRQYRDASFADISALNSAYGPGFYSMAYGAGSVSSLGFPSGVFLPNTPIATLSEGFWSGGEFFTDVADSLTISSNLFTSNYATSHGAVQLLIRSSGGETVAIFNMMTNRLLPFSLSAFSLTAGQSYEVDLTFSSFVNPATTGPDSFAFLSDTSGPHTSFLATYAEDTHFVVRAFASTSSAVPEPSSYGAAAVAVLGIAAWLRRRNPREKAV